MEFSKEDRVQKWRENTKKSEEILWCHRYIDKGHPLLALGLREKEQLPELREERMRVI